MILEYITNYITNIYILPLITTIIGLIIVYLYDKFEKKQYTKANYLRIGLLIYVSTFATIYISRLDFFKSNSIGGGVGGISSEDINSQSLMPQPNEMKSYLEHFKTGVPTF
jgi:hypothetical protein